MQRGRHILDEALRRARAAGARRAEVFSVAGTGRSVEYSDRGLESYRGSAAAGIGLRVFLGHRAGFAYGQDFGPAGLERLAVRAVESAAVAELRSFPTPRGAAPARDPGILDASGLAATVADDRSGLERAIAQARAVDHAVRRIKTASLRSARREVSVRSTTGTDVSYARSTFSLVIGVVAERAGQSELGWEAEASTARVALPWETIGRAAAVKALARLGACRPKSGRQPAILDREVVADFLSMLAATLSADAVLKGRSLWSGKVGSAAAAAAVTLVDDPTLSGAVGSAPCDDEGQPTRRKTLIDAGVLAGYLHTLETAHRMGVPPTGNGFRRDYEAAPLPHPGNLLLLPGTRSPEDWLRGEGDVVLVDEILGAHTMNPVSGDFSVGAAGYVCSGAARRPFRGATIAGNLGALLLAVAEVGNDQKFFGSVAAPSVLVSSLDISA